MSKLLLTTVYEDILSKIETSLISEVDIVGFQSGLFQIKKEITDKKYGRVIVSLSNPVRYELFLSSIKEKFNRPLVPEESKFYIRLFFNRWIIFTAQDIIIYRILLSHFINYQKDGVAKIDLDTIHKKYRNKAFMYKSNENKYDEMTLKVYKNVITKLTTAQLFLRFGESKRKSFLRMIYNGQYSISNNLIELKEPIDIEKIATEKIVYSIGGFGNYIMQSYQYSQIMPKELYQVRFNQIDTFNIGVYISKMIFINKRGRKTLNIYVSTILSRINKYDQKGYSISMTYLDYLNSIKDPVKRNKKIKYIEKQLNYILNLFVKEEKIKKYKYIGKFNYKFIKEGELMIQLVFNSKG